jgi:2-methylcitrate dehydratase PrpD
MATTSSERLSEKFGVLTYGDLPPSVRQVARQCLLDWFACAIAGSREDLSILLREELLGTSAGPAIIAASAAPSSVVAALVNGAAGHALDYDDTSIIMTGHPTVPVMPAALAQAELLGASGADLVTALVVGIEVETLMAQLLGFSHYERGWHTTSTIGVFGAAAASARLLELDAAGWGNALGLAGTQSGGVKASFGTMAKPFHAGRAAADGLFAARLAARGFIANPGVVEANQGFAQAAGSEPVDLGQLDQSEGRWFTDDVLFKYHASCYLTHSTLNAALSLFPKAEPDVVDSVVVTVSPSLLDVCNIEAPKTGLEGKFSLRATVALALLGEDTADVGTFSDAQMADPALVAMRERVEVRTAPGHPLGWAEVTIASTDGRTLRAESDSGIPAADLDAQGAKLRAKFDALVSPVLGFDAAQSLAEAIEHVEQVGDVRELVALAAGS